MREVNREIVSAVIKSLDNKILLIKENPKFGGVFLGVWHIPGGGLLEDESLENGLIREVREEVGIDISNYTANLVDNSQYAKKEKTLESGERVLANMHFNDYLIEIKNRNANEMSIKLEEVISKFGWFNIDELSDIDLTPPLKLLFVKLGYTRKRKNS